MGRDKALLQIANTTLIESIAGRVHRATGSVTLVAPPGRYAHLGIPTIPDLVEGCGPLGGILTALTHTQADWNLIVACDMPDVTTELFVELLEAAEHTDSLVLVPSVEGGFEPLCNPISQAEMLNRHGSEFNIVMGLCIGHDSLFFKYAKGLTTVLVAKDRVLGHNPVAALQLADTYYSRVWGPDKPAKPPKLPAAGRRVSR